MSTEPILFVSDTHRPYHDKRAWALMLRVAKELTPKIIVIIGDYADFFGVSSHSKDPRRVLKLPAEMADANKGLDELDALPASRKIFVAGNHCDRLTRYLQDKAPELFDFVTIPGLLHLKPRGWEYVPYRHHTRIGKLYLTHDVGAAGRNSTFKALDTYMHSVVTGHAHRMQYIVEGTAVGEWKVAAQFGWLGDVRQVEYMHRAVATKNWALGFGVGYHDPKTGCVYLQPVPIINYSCVVNGRLYK